MAAERVSLTNTLHRQLAILAHYVRLAGQNNLSSSHVVAETTMTGLLNRVYGWKLVNANTISQNYPGVDLIDRDNNIAVQVTATRTVEKVRHTLEEAGRGGVVYSKLIVMLLTDEQPTQGMRTCTVPTYSGPMEVWNLGDVLRIGKELDMDRLEELTEFMKAELGTIEERARDLPHLEFPPETALPPTAFVGREVELAEIRSRFAGGDRQVVLMGLGGMGKTELAARYGREHPGMVYFVRFETNFTRTIEKMVHGIRPKLHDEELKLDSAILRKKVLDLLEKSGSDDLLIIDNADSPTGVLADLLKHDDYKTISRLPLKLLLTTRSDTPRPIPVEPMPEEPLFEIFRNHGAELTEAEMRDLIKAVNGHTLTIDLIARTLADNWVPVYPQEMLDAIANTTLSQEDFPEVGTDYNQDMELMHIYQRLRTVFRVADIPGLEKQVLRCATLLPKEGMDVRLFRNALTAEQRKVFPRVGKQGWLSADDRVLTIHPIIRLVCLTELEPKESDCEAFLNGLWAQYDQKEYRPTQYSQMANLFTVAHDRFGKYHGRWLNCSGIIWNDLNEDQTLYDLYKARLSTLEEVIPPNDPELATAYNYYGIALGELGHHSEALAYGEKALLIRKAVLPENAPDLARSLNNVGDAYGNLGDYRKELEYKLKALAIFKGALYKEAPDLATSYNNVGYAYGELGEHQKALEYQQKALEIWRKVLSPEHPTLALSYSNVGDDYNAMGNHQIALEYHQKALAIQEKVLSADHPDLATSYNNVGNTYGKEGDYKHALEYHQKALAIREKVFPADHTDLAASYNNVGCTYGDLGDHKRELEYHQKALAILEKALPTDHPNLAISCNNIAGAYYKLRNLHEAARYMRRAADIISRSSLPKTHPNRVNYPKWADRFEAEAEMERKIKRTMQGFGTTPPAFPFGKK